MLPVVILAGGLATRLRPFKKKIPKALIKISGKPFIYHQLTYLHKEGVKRVIICVGYLGDMIKNFVGNGEKFGIEVSYSEDWPHLLGTGGAIKNALPLIRNKFFILYGDTFLPINYKDIVKFHLKNKSKSVITIIKNKGMWDKSNINFKNNKIIEYNKFNNGPEMEYIDYGLSLLSKSVFNKYPPKKSFDLSVIFRQLIIQKKLLGFEVYKRFYEIGSIKGLRQTKKFLKKKN
jgi:NDP-sugar pyrophosphorylase family protein